MQLDWLELLYILAGIIGGGALLFRRGRRTVSKSDTVAETPPQKPPAERYDHEGTIEERDAQTARNKAKVAADTRDAGDRWKSF